MSAVVSLFDHRHELVGAPLRVLPGDRVLRMADLPARVGMSRATIYRRIADGSFPAPVPLGGTSVSWRESDIDAWIAGLGQGGGQ